MFRKKYLCEVSNYKSNWQVQGLNQKFLLFMQRLTTFTFGGYVLYSLLNLNSELKPVKSPMNNTLSLGNSYLVFLLRL